jgi:penicillin G amidase
MKLKFLVLKYISFIKHRRVKKLGILAHHHIAMTSKSLRVVIGILLSFVIIVLGVLGAAYYVLHKSQVRYDSDLALRGLTAPVKIYYDDYAAAHLTAENEHDLFFAQGFTHARERLWQMEIQRRAASGRLAEILGRDALGYDKLFRTIGTRRMADSLWKWNGLSEDTRQTLTAYSDGVNAFLESVKQGNANLPIEFTVLSYEPDAWKPEDCLAIVRLMGWELNIAWHIDITLAELTAKLGAEKAAELLPDYPDNKPIIAPDFVPPSSVKPNPAKPNEIKPSQPKKKTAAVYEQPSPDVLASLSSFRTLDTDFRIFFGTMGSHIGSNSWAVTRTKSTSGKAILCNDPHLGFMTPSRWYEVHLVCSKTGINAAGCSLPGTPAIVLGKNDAIAWGLTNVMADDADFFLTNDSLETFSEIIEEIKIKNDNPFLLPVHVSAKRVEITDEIRYGFNRLHSPIFDSVKSHKKIIAMQWTGLEKSDELRAIKGLLTASSWTSFRESLSHYAVPGQNFLYADTAGNIGMQSAARLPVRRDKQGFSLRTAGDSLSEWQGMLAFDEIPNVYNPASDVIVTANNKLTSRAYPHYISALWEPPSRAERLTELLTKDSAKQFSSEMMQAMQSDVVSPAARDMMPFLLEALTNDTTPSHRKAIQYLKNWQYEFGEKSIGATIYAQFLKQLLYNTFADEMGEESYQGYITLMNTPLRVVQKMIQDTIVTTIVQDSVMISESSHSAWFDNVNTPQVESRDDVLRKSFDDALMILNRNLGSDESRWQWGRLHTLTVRHFFGQKNPKTGEENAVGKRFNFETIVTAGTSTTINNGEYRLRQPDTLGQSLVAAEHILGPSSRRVIDMGVAGTFKSSLPGGNSGDPINPHYSDQLPLWHSGKLREFLTDMSLISTRNFPCTTLRPAP